jgi:thiol-disulfide isomerase/thioredoxin
MGQTAESPVSGINHKLTELQVAFTNAQATYETASAALSENAEGEKKGQALWKVFDQKQSELFCAAVDIAKQDPKSETALAALEWVLTKPRSYFLPCGIPAMQLAASDHAANPRIGKIIAWVGYYTPHEGATSRPTALALIDAVAKTNPDRTARGQAVIAHAWQAREKFEQTESEGEAAEAEKAFETVLSEYADCPRLKDPNSRTLGEEAEQELFALRHLRIGKPAPEIKGEDLEGRKFALSESRGKITVLVFWASWCGPCMQMVPHERELVKQMAGKPFVLVGINGDAILSDARRATVKNDMTWRSFWNGKEGPQGPIARAWNVRGWPTVYVLDAKGIIRAREVFDKELEKTVTQLLEEMKGKS